MSDEKLSNLTRSILTSVALGSVAVTQVGCAAFSKSAGSDVRPHSQLAEQALCDTALQTRSVSDINAAMRAYPDGDCIAALLNAMPPEVLAQLSPELVAGLSPQVLDQLSPATLAALPQVTAAAPRRIALDDNDSY